MNRVFQTIKCALLITACLLPVGSEAWAQNQKTGNEKSGFVDPAKGSEELRREVEPGVYVYGYSHRFAEVGDVQAFDTSPDGRTIVCALGGKLKFFDLEENQVTAEVGEPRERYSSVLYSPDGRYVFAIGNGGQAGNHLPFVRIFDAIDQSVVGVIPTKEKDPKNPNHAWFHVQQFAVSADANFVAVASHDELFVREVDSAELVYHTQELGYVQGLAFSPDETSLYVSGNRFQEIDLELGEKKTGSDSGIVKRASGQTLAVNLSKNLLATPSSGSITLFNTEEERKINTLRMPSKSYPQKMQFSDDGSLLATSTWRQSKNGSSGQAVVVIDVESNKVIKDMLVPSQGLQRIRFATDNSSVYLAGHGFFGILEVRLDQEDNVEEVVQAKYPSGPAASGYIHPDGSSFVTCSQGGEVTWFDFETGEATQAIQVSRAKGLQPSNDENEFLLISQWARDGQALSKINYEDGKAVKNFSVLAKKKSGVFSQMHSMLFAGGPQVKNSSSSPVDAKFSEDGDELHVLSTGWEFVSTVGFGGGGSEQKFFLDFVTLDAETGAKKRALKLDREKLGFQKNSWIQSGAVDPTGKFVAIAGQQQQVFLLDCETGEVAFEFKKEGNYVRSLAFSPDGRFLVLKGHQKITLIDVDTEEEVEGVNCEGMRLFAFSQDGKRMALAGSGKTTKLVVMETDGWGKICERENSEANRSSLTLSNDGEKLLVGLADCRMELLDLQRVEH